VNFRPIGTFGLPEYPGQMLAFPPFLEVLDRLERLGCRELIISTPGPVGLLGLAAAWLFGIRTIGIYHTDIPAYVRTYTQDSSLEDMAWRFMHAFYGSMDAIVAPSDCCRRQLIHRGFEASKIHVMERGVDLEQFRPDRRAETFYGERGLQAGFTFLYVGRVSREKNLDVLLESFMRLRARGEAGNLAIVGDGPYLDDLRRRFNDARIAYLGYLHGEELAAAYASADAFVFPSTTDTFGNVVLEAQASGLPAIVSDRGGPQEIVARHGSGLVVNMLDPTMLGAAMQELISDPALCQNLRERALTNARECSWSTVLQHLWEIGEWLIDEPADLPIERDATMTSPILEFS
jgi:glycosyltransferase involved in cell wall biosynthesis